MTAVPGHHDAGRPHQGPRRAGAPRDGCGGVDDAAVGIGQLREPAGLPVACEDRDRGAAARGGVDVPTVGAHRDAERRVDRAADRAAVGTRAVDAAVGAGELHQGSELLAIAREGGDAAVGEGRRSVDVPVVGAHDDRARPAQAASGVVAVGHVGGGSVHDAAVRSGQLHQPAGEAVSQKHGDVTGVAGGVHVLAVAARGHAGDDAEPAAVGGSRRRCRRCSRRRRSPAAAPGRRARRLRSPPRPRARRLRRRGAGCGGAPGCPWRVGALRASIVGCASRPPRAGASRRAGGATLVCERRQVRLSRARIACSSIDTQRVSRGGLRRCEHDRARHQRRHPLRAERRSGGARLRAGRAAHGDGAAVHLCTCAAEDPASCTA